MKKARSEAFRDVQFAKLHFFASSSILASDKTCRRGRGKDRLEISRI